ncbi:MAG: cob(I)yrinic acid a,c-diamide adenosyltransferase [Chloroflexota bacterium]
MGKNRFFTGKGDDGTTGLLGEGRVLKTDVRMEALGALDETSASLGLARSLSGGQPVVARLVMRIQRELYLLMAEVAATADNTERFRSVGAENVTWLEEQADGLSDQIEMPHEFILPGDTPAAAAFSLARTVCRRAERRVVALRDAGGLTNPHILPYLNRLSSLCFILELYVIQSGGNVQLTLAKD